MQMCVHCVHACVVIQLHYPKNYSLHSSTAGEEKIVKCLNFIIGNAFLSSFVLWYSKETPRKKENCEVPRKIREWGSEVPNPILSRRPHQPAGGVLTPHCCIMLVLCSLPLWCHWVIVFIFHPFALLCLFLIDCIDSQREQLSYKHGDNFFVLPFLFPLH